MLKRVRHGRAWALALLLFGCSTVDPGRVSTDLKGRLIDEGEVRQTVAVRFVPRSTREAVDYAGSGIRGNARDERRRYGAERTTIPDPAADRWLESLTARLAQAWPAGPPPPIPRVQLVADKSYGAAALSDGSIRLNLGTLLQAGTVDEVAFVLGHEMGHLFLRHQGQREDEHDDADNLREVTTGVGALGAALSAAHFTNNGNVTLTGLSRDRTAMVGLGSLVLSEGLDTLVDPAWARKQEAQADVFGLDLMVAAGFDPRYALTSMEALASSRAATTARVKAMMDQVQARIGSDLSRGDVNGSLRTTMAGATSLLGTVGREFRGMLRERHPEPAERRQWLDDYRDRIHGDAALRPDSPGELERVRSSAVIRNATLALAEIEASQAALARGDARSAIDRAQAAIQAAPWLLAARLHLALARLEAGEVRQARDGLRAVAADPKAPLIAFLVLAQAEARLGETQAALAVLETAGRRFDAAEELAPERIALYATAGNRPAAEAEAERCGASRNPRLRAACREALGSATATRTASAAGLGAGAGAVPAAAAAGGSGFGLPSSLKLPSLPSLGLPFLGR